MPQGSLVAARYGQAGWRRAIYFAQLAAGELWMLFVYPKAVRDNIPGHTLKAIRNEIEDDLT